MGAIFTAGGLVVAMVSLFTLWSVDQRARVAAETAVDELREQTDHQLEHRISAYDLFTQARAKRQMAQFAAAAAEAFGDQKEVMLRRLSGVNLPSLADAGQWLEINVLTSLDEAEDLIQQAVETAPIRGARTWLASELYETVIREFIQYHAAGPGDVRAPAPAPSRLHRAAKWLELAIREDARDGAHHAWFQRLLADVYGMMGDLYEEMVAELQRGLRSGEMPHPHPEWSVVCLCHGCGPVEDRLKYVGSLLKVDIPWSADRIRVLFDKAEQDRPGGALQQVWVLNRPGLLPSPGDSPLSPALVTLHPRGPGRGSAMWLPVRQAGPTVRRAGIPPIVDDGTQHQPDMPLDELLPQFHDRFFVLAQGQ